MSTKAKLTSKKEPPRPRGRPNAEDVLELEARLIRVARQIFIAHGYGATAMNEVARAAGVSKTTLYARFRSKADLFRAIIDEQLQRAGVRLRQINRPACNTLETKLRDYMEHMTRLSLSGDIFQVNRLIFSEAARFPELGDAAWRRTRVGIHHVAALIEEYSVKDGVPCSDSMGAAEIYILMQRGWYYDRMLRERPVSSTETSAAIEKILTMFLASRTVW